MNNLILEVITGMSDYLNNDQISKLKFVLSKCLDHYDVITKTTEIAFTPQTENNQLLKMYLAWISTEGKTERTLSQYKFVLSKALKEINKNIADITENDIFMYLSIVKYHGASNTYLRNIRQVLSPFFGWLYTKDFIKQNPMKGINPIKIDKDIKAAFSDVELERIRNGASNLRDLAIIELLYSTGIRISELVHINRDDIDYVNKIIKVLGKGKKERYVYMTNITMYYLQQYLQQRTDSNAALFISSKKPYKRLQPSGVQCMLHCLGDKLGIEKVHPHRFRRTLATNLLRKGMSIEDVSKILGHEKLDTTMLYCNISQDTVRNEYMRIMCA